MIDAISSYELQFDSPTRLENEDEVDCAVAWVNQALRLEFFSERWSTPRMIARASRIAPIRLR